MNTQTISTKFTLNTNKVHDQLDTLRAALNAMARDHELDGAFEAGVLRDTLADTDLGQRYLALIHRADLLAHLPDRRTVLRATLAGAGIYLLAHRTGLDKRAGRALRRTTDALRARFTRKPHTPPPFTVTPAATTVFDIVGSDAPVTVMIPTNGEHEVRSGKLITLDDEYFAVLVGEQPYVFLPDQIAAVALNVDATGDNTRAVITLIENPIPLPDAL